MPQVAFNDLSAEKTTLYISQLTHSSAVVFATPSTFEAWTNAIPCAYIFCSMDNALPLPIQQGMALRFGPDAETYTLQSGHCPFLSIPEELLEVMEKASAGLLE